MINMFICIQAYTSRFYLSRKDKMKYYLHFTKIRLSELRILQVSLYYMHNIMYKNLCDMSIQIVDDHGSQQFVLCSIALNNFYPFATTHSLKFSEVDLKKK